MSNTTTSTNTASNYPARHDLLALIADSHASARQIDAAAIAAVREHGALHYPDAVTLILDSNGYPDEYVLHSVLTDDCSPAENNAALADDDDLLSVVHNLPHDAIRYDENTRLWKVTLR